MHAEPKCILDLLHHGHKEKEFILFCNYSPCDPCANLIGYSELFKLVVYKRFAENWPNALKRLNSFSVNVIEIKIIGNLIDTYTMNTEILDYTFVR